MKTVIGIVVLVVCVGGVYVLNDMTRTEDGRSRLHVAAELPISVELAEPERRVIVRTVQAPGEVEALDEVDISSEVMGKIIEMPVEEGDFVQAGDLLCRLDDVDYKARLISAEANVAKVKALMVQAQADLEFAERNYDEAQHIRESGAMTSLDFRNIQTALARARAVIEMREKELIEAEAVLDSARDDLDKTIIRAPITGVVSQRFADPGEVVITGTMNNPGTRVMVISNLSKMQVRCKVAEADAPLVQPGQPARIYLQSDTRKSVAGEVLRVGTKGTKPLGRDVVSFETLVLITGEDERVMSGMSANVEIEVARNEDALTIPVQAVVYRKRRDLPEEIVKEFDRRQAELVEGERQSVAEYIKLVFCVEDERAHPRLIETGINDVESVEVLDGLVAEDTIVTGPYRSLDQLKDDSKIELLKDEDELAAEDEDTEDNNGEASADGDAEADDDSSTEEPVESDAGAE